MHIPFKIICNNNPISLKIKQELTDFLLANNNFVSPEAKNIIVIGGDGTFLKAFRQYNDQDVKIALINTGTVGFYEALKPNEMTRVIDIFNDDKNFFNPFIIDILFKQKHYQAINEVVITSNNTLCFDIMIDQVHYQSFKGTGVCLSTSTGSTGYNKSLKGSILLPYMKLWQMTEIAPIMHASNRTLGNSIILLPETTVSIDNFKQHEDGYIVVDGKNITNDLTGEKVILSYSLAKIKICFNCNLKNFLEKISKVFIGEKHD